MKITRRGYWRVMRGTTQVSQHTTPEEAYESASRNLPCVVSPPQYDVPAEVPHHAAAQVQLAGARAL